MHGGDIYNNRVSDDFSVNLNPYLSGCAGYEDEYRADLMKTIARGLQDGLAGADRYPDPEQRDIRKRLSTAEGVGEDCVFAGCGSSQLIMAAAFAIRPRTALLVEPCFSGYARALDAVGDCDIRRYFLSEEDGFVLGDGILQALAEDTDAVFLTDPNNPTGLNTDPSLLVRILDRAAQCGCAVVLDESFYTISDGYERDRTRRLEEACPDLYVIRSLTKSFALPGIRMGYVISSAANISRIRRFLPEWNLPALSEAVMRTCIRLWEDERLYDRSMDLIRKERAYLAGELSGLGFTVFDSDTVYLLAKGPEGLYDRLLEDHVLIRNCSDFEGLGHGYYRFAVRDHDANAHLIDIISKRI